MTTTTERAKALLAGITPKKWELKQTPNRIEIKLGTSLSFYAFTLRDKHNAAFIAAAPELVRELCEEVERLRGMTQQAGDTLYRQLSEAQGDDFEAAHANMDDALIAFVRELGFDREARLFENQEKWYA